MHFKFSLTHKNLVAESLWSGELTYEIMVEGIIEQNKWILQNSDKFPLVLVSDYSKANLNNITETDLQKIADQFHGEADLFPDMAWIAVMPGDVKYEIVRLWLEHAESLFRDSHVVKNPSMAKDIISDLLMRYQQDSVF